MLRVAMLAISASACSCHLFRLVRLGRRGKRSSKLVLDELAAEELERRKDCHVARLTLLALFKGVETDFRSTLIPRTIQETIGLTQIANAILQRVREDVITPIFALFLASDRVCILDWWLASLLFI